MNSTLAPTLGVSTRRTSHHATALLASFMVPFVVHASILANLFYERGTALCDTGLFASVLWQPTWKQTLPAAVVDLSAGSTMCALNLSDTYLSTHLAPWFWVLGAPSHLLPIGPTGWFTLVHGALMALIGVMGWKVVQRTALEQGAIGQVPAWLLGQIFAFNGIVLVSVAFPHFELLIPCAVLAVLLVLPREGLRVALPLLVLAQCLREDVGLHTAAFALAIGTARLLDGGRLREQRDLLLVAASGIVLSLVAMTLQRLVFGGGGSLEKIYIGTPPWGHLDAALVLERLRFMLTERGYVLILFPVAVVHAHWRRSWVPLAALASCLPWLLLHLLAVKREPATLYMYYAFPVMAAYLWPLVGEAYIRTTASSLSTLSRSRHRWRGALTACLLMLVLSTLATPFYTIRFLGHHALPRSGTLNASLTERFLDQAVDDATLGIVLLDTYSGALRPTLLPYSRIWDDDLKPRGDSLIFHAKWARRPTWAGSLATAGMKDCYGLPGTPFRLATRLDRPEVLIASFALTSLPLATCDGTAE